MKTKDEVIGGFMKRNCAMLMDVPTYNAINSQLEDVWQNGYQTSINDSKNAIGKYFKGYEDGRYIISNMFIPDDLFEVDDEKKKEIEDEAYQRGLADAWEAARKIVSTDGLDYRELIEIFGMDDMIIDEFTAQEAIRRIKEYEEKKKAKAEAEAEEEIHVGDEVVKQNGTTFTVAEITEIFAYGIDHTGRFASEVKKNLHKTGRHFPQVEQLLKEMGE